ncbi:unnamed protein product [Linum trigynum]|uniref:Uncharacterized protein n=1 Tax=Linum trigynum TaxID=586398 RepID=A0AAV2EQI7_9ROSI
MPGYEGDGPLMNRELDLVGQYNQIHNGLGWLGLEDGPDGDELSLADQPVKWAEPELDQRGPGGPRRATEPGGGPESGGQRLTGSS